MALFFWFLLALSSIQINLENLIINIIIYIVITLISFFFVEKYFKIPQQQKSDKPYKFSQLIIRALFAGGLVSGVVFISNFFNAYITGIFASFPAVLLSSMIILAFNQNIAFARATGKILILSTSNIVVYSLVVYFTYPSMGLLWGTIVSFLSAFIWVWIFHPLVRKNF